MFIHPSLFTNPETFSEFFNGSDGKINWKDFHEILAPSHTITIEYTNIKSK